MYRQVWQMSFVLLAGIVTATTAAAQGPKDSVRSKELIVELGGGVKLTMVLIPEGEFTMGSAESAEATAAFFRKSYGDPRTADAFNREHPQHRVRITQPFYLGMYHVTRGQFRQFVADTGYRTEMENDLTASYGWNREKKAFDFHKDYCWRNPGFEQTDDHPVVNVSWKDAVAFCDWMSRKERRQYRLPTEAEWEYACRAGTTTRYHCGDDPETLVTVANVGDEAYRRNFPDQNHMISASDGYVFTSPVGCFKPNAAGLYDMHGNAWQWCSDFCGREYCTDSCALDPTGPESGSGHVLRGGCWFEDPSRCRSAYRRSSGDFRDFGDGFRIARTQSPSEK